MRKVIAILICMLFSFVSFGGNIYIHKCQEATLLSLYNSIDAENCPFCAKTHHEEGCGTDNHCHGDCSNEIVPIDQLSQSNYQVSQPSFLDLCPAIIPILWISTEMYSSTNVELFKRSYYIFTPTDSSPPPLYIRNCVFRN